MTATRAKKGVVFMVTASLFFCVMSSLIKFASDIDPYRTTFFRFVVGLGVLGAAAMFGKIQLRFVHGGRLFFRGLFGAAAIYIMFLSISKLGLAKGTVLFCTYPIFASIFSTIALKEKLGIVKIIAIPTAFFGMYMLSMAPGGDDSGTAVGMYEIIAVCGAVFAGIAIVLVKKLHETDSSIAIFFAQCLIGLWLVAIPANAVHQAIGYSGWIILLGIGLAATVGQLLMTEGYKYVPVSTGVLMEMLILVLNFLVGITIFNEPVSVRSVVGSAIVLASCIAVLAKIER